MKKLYFLFLLVLAGFIGFGQVTSESFNNLPVTPVNSYFTVNWTGDNGLPWTATDSRIDQVLNTGNKAIGLRFGTISCANIPNGVDSIAFSYKYLFTTGGTAALTIKVNGTAVGTLSVPVSQTTPATAIFKNFTVSGNFLLEIVEGTSGPRIAIDDIVWRSVSSTPCAAPTAQPTALTFSNNTTTTINGSFTAASPVADEYLIVRSIGAFVGNPANGTVYSTSDAIGTNGTVVGRGSAVAFSDASLNSGTTYTYTVFSLNSSCAGGPVYFTTAPLVATSTTATPTPCATPTGTITNVQFSASSTAINGTFSPAADADGSLVVMSTNATLTFTPVNGTAYSAGQTVGNGTVIKFGAGNTFSEAGLTPSTTYYFFLFPLNTFNCAGGPLYNAVSANANTNTLAAGAVGYPATYYDTVTNLSSPSCAQLKSALKWRTNTLLPGASLRSYADLYTQYVISDIKPREVNPGSANVIWDIYSDVPGPANDVYNFTPVTQEDHGNCGGSEGSCYNREHSVPLSWFGGSTATPASGGTDYNFIFPTDKEVNALRNNFIYGEVANAPSPTANGSKLGSSAIAGFTGSVFEPINEYKGDVARAFLYFVTRFESNISGYPGASPNSYAGSPVPFDKTSNSGTFPSVQIEYLRLMLKWAAQDPVSQKEIDRNNAAQNYQGNRNPFIDHPEYITMIWNANCTGLTPLPVDVVFFRGNLAGSKVLLQWEVQNEQKLANYDIERSTNGTDFAKIGTVKAINAANYNFNEDISQLSGRRLYYRLKKVDVDGKFQYSAVFTVHVPLNLQFNVYPNPTVNDFVNVAFTKPTVKNALLTVTDIMGRNHQQIAVSIGTLNMVVNLKNVPAGMYIIKLIQDGNTVTQKIQVL